MSNLTELKLSVIHTDGGTQPRAELNQVLIEEYAEAMKTGALFPPITVFYDGTHYWLADGFHRVEAARKTNASTIEAEVHQGTLRDAVLYSVGVNATHGLRRSNDDKRKAVQTLLCDPEWSQWTDREIARQCGVGNRFVGETRRKLNLSVSRTQIQNFTHNTNTHRKVKRGDKNYSINTTNIGKGQKNSTPPFQVDSKPDSEAPLSKDSPTSIPSEQEPIMPLEVQGEALSKNKSVAETGNKAVSSPYPEKVQARLHSEVVPLKFAIGNRTQPSVPYLNRCSLAKVNQGHPITPHARLKLPWFGDEIEVEGKITAVLINWQYQGQSGQTQVPIGQVSSI